MEEGEAVIFSTEGTKEEIKDITMHVKEEPLEVMEEGEAVNFSAEGTNIKEDLKDLTIHIKEEPLDSLVEDIYSRAAVIYKVVALPEIQGAPSEGLTEDYSLYSVH